MNDNHPARDRALAIELAARALRASLEELDDSYRDSDPDRWKRALKQRRIALHMSDAAGIGNAPVIVSSAPVTWSRAMIMASTDLQLKARLSEIADRVGWEAQTIRAELRARADERGVRP